MHQTTRRHHVATTLASAIALALLTSPAYADIDRLQLINGVGQPSVNPGTELSKGVLFENQLIFAGTNLTTTAQRELHGATLADRAFVIEGANPPGDDIPIIGVTLIDEFAGSVLISHSNGVDALGTGAFSSNVVAGGNRNGQQSVEQAGNYYLISENSNADFELQTFSNTTGSFTTIDEVALCSQSVATAGSSTVIYIDSDVNTLNKVIAPSTQPQAIFTGGLVQPFTVPCSLTTLNGSVLLDAFEAGTGSNQIYITDGTSSGTTRLRGFNIEGNGTFSPNFREFNGRLIFGATDSGDGAYGVWSTDGTSSGTVLLADAAANSGQVAPNRGVIYKDVLFFPVQSTLWQSDGTADGTFQVQLNGASIQLPFDTSFTEFDEELHFVATIDGSTQILRMANPGDTPEVVSGITQRPVAVNGKLGGELLVAADNNLFTMVSEPVLTIAANTEVAENAGSGNVSVLIELREAVPYDVSFVVNTEDGSAIAGNDYIQLQNQTLTITAGTVQTTAVIQLQNDLANEDTETFVVRLSNPDGARFDNRTDTSITGTVTITDSDQPVQAGALQVQPTQVAEDGGNAIVNVITGGSSAVEITFDYVITGGTATAGSDFTGGSGSGSIAANASSTTISIPVNDDSIDEPNETFTVTVTPTAGLSSGVGVALPPTNVTIIDNDDAPVVTPVDPVTPPASGGSSGGGCSIASGPNKDPMLPALLLLAMGVVFGKRRSMFKRSANA